MKIKLIILFSLVSFLWVFQTPETFGDLGNIKWYTYQEGMARAKSENKKIFISFYADWCVYCKKMEKNTFTDSTIKTYLEEHFISIKVNTDKEKKIAANYFVKGLPSTWFVEPDGKKISSLPGYISPEMLIKILRFIQTDSYKSMNFKEFLKKD